MRRVGLPVAIVAAALLGACAGTLPFVPATYLQPRVQQATDGRLVLADTQGTVWNGRAHIAFESGGRTEQRREAALPSALAWHVDDIGIVPPRIAIRVTSDGMLDAPVMLTWSWHAVGAQPGRLRLPADVLEAVGAPLNTLKPGGWVTISWDTLSWKAKATADAAPTTSGTVTLDWADARSALSPTAPLGTYRMQARAEGTAAAVDLSTISGPLLLSGTGRWTVANGLQFRGEARPEAGRETELATLLVLLGPVSNGVAQLRIGT